MTVIIHESLPLFLIIYFVFIIIHLYKANQDTHSIRITYRHNVSTSFEHIKNNQTKNLSIAKY